tara:strand:- start:1772 stop:2146 length:375 start_codon:yes stop_codon:yes gene_type:complete
MGNSFQKNICCLKNRKYEDEEFLYLSKKSKNFLNKKRKKSVTKKNVSLVFFNLYTLSTSATIVIVVLGGPVTLLVTIISGVGISLYYLYCFRKYLKRIDSIDQIFKNRDVQRFEIYENIYISKK